MIPAPLQRKYVPHLEAALQGLGLTVQSHKGPRIEVCCPETQEHLCTFQWCPAALATPGHWTVTIAFDLYAVRDLTTAIIEIQRVRQLRKQAREAWKDYLASKSRKRWTQYRSYVAALFKAKKDPLT